MFEYLIGGFILGIFAGMAIVNTWNYFWDTHGERPFFEANPSCGMDGCLWERDWENSPNA